MNPGFWRDRRVLLTGHTGFKGAWLALWLERLGAQVSAVALAPHTDPSLFQLLAPWRSLDALIGDLRDPEVARAALEAAAPEVVFHLAAQALVRPGYADPVGTFASNVLGTAHLLDAVRHTPSVRVVVVVTSDKVYANDDRGRPFREDARLGGRDPYSASKACQELVTACYRESFFQKGPRIASARAGNVIGGGDWGKDRLIPDFVRAIAAGEPVRIRHPQATRPWQHVLDPLAGYLIYAEKLWSGEALPAALNFGPPGGDVRPVRWVIERLLNEWGDGAGWQLDAPQTLREARALTLDPGLAGECLDWQPRLPLDRALDWTVAWYRTNQAGLDVRSFSNDQIAQYEELLG